MKNHENKMGVLVLMAHLIITLVVLGIYAFTLFSGQEDDTLRTILTVIVGYWFGAMGKDMLKPATKVENHHVERMEVKEEKK